MPTLGYWKIRGLASPIRLLLTYVGEEFENVMYEQGDGPEYSREPWFKIKSTMTEQLDFPNLPYFIDGDLKITQSNAILKHLARKHKLDGESVKDKAIVDMLLDVAMDFRNKVFTLVYIDNYETSKEKHFENIQTSLALFEKKLGDKQWFAGDKITVADFPFYELLDQHLRMKPGCLNAYPKLIAFLKRFEALPVIKDYLSKEDVRNLPINNKVAGFTG